MLPTRFVMTPISAVNVTAITEWAEMENATALVANALNLP